jgi:hypothetical protein
MTHTEKPEEWEEEFERDFGGGYEIYGYKVKSFITSLLARQKEDSYEQGKKDEREKIRKAVEGMGVLSVVLNDRDNKPKELCYLEGANSIVIDLLTLLDNK